MDASDVAAGSPGKSAATAARGRGDGQVAKTVVGPTHVVERDSADDQCTDLPAEGQEVGPDAFPEGDHEEAQDARSMPYAAALRERLARIRSELEQQSHNIISVQQSLANAEEEKHANQAELAQLRRQWTSDQFRRDAFLKETAEAERQLAIRERWCAEACATAAARAEAAACAGADTAREKPRERERDQRHRLATLEEQRVRLTAALQELRDSAKQEEAEVEQLRVRAETLRKESRALKSAANAAQEGEEQATFRLESLHAAAATGKQRQALAERMVADAKAEVQELRAELLAVSNAIASGTPAPATTPAGGGVTAGKGGPPGSAVTSNIGGGKAPSLLSAQPGSGTAQAEADPVLLATNKRLAAKVASMREQLRGKRRHLESLRKTA